LRITSALFINPDDACVVQHPSMLVIVGEDHSCDLNLQHRVAARARITRKGRPVLLRSNDRNGWRWGLALRLGVRPCRTPSSTSILRTGRRESRRRAVKGHARCVGKAPRRTFRTRFGRDSGTSLIFMVLSWRSSATRSGRFGPGSVRPLRVGRLREYPLEIFDLLAPQVSCDLYS